MKYFIVFQLFSLYKTLVNFKSIFLFRVYFFKFDSYSYNSNSYFCFLRVAACCWSFHYIKRVLETLFVHRFSHNTMPIMNLFKNCSYYWGFTAFVSYFVNHPLYTPPCTVQFYIGLGTFIVSIEIKLNL